MLQSDIEQVRLDEEDKQFLMAVFQRRRKFLLTVYLFLVVVGFGVSFQGAADRRPRRSYLYSDYSKRRIHKWGDEPDSKILSKKQVWMVDLAFIETIILATGVVFYYKSVYKIKKDIELGMKEKIPYPIIRKQEVQLVDRYYVYIEMSGNFNYEVSQEQYENCTEGDIIYVYRTPHAKFVFKPNGRYDII